MGPNRVPPHRRQNLSFGNGREKSNATTVRQDFDRETGQIYQESEVVFKKRYGSDWIGELKTPEIAQKPVLSDTGTRSLLETTIIKCAREMRDLTSQHFETVPWSLASAVWDEIVSSHGESFHAWRTLAAAYNTAAGFGRPEYRYHLRIKQPPLPLQEYFRGISSMNDRWLTALRISPKQISIPDLVAIANVKNLAVLDLSDGQILLDTRPMLFDERIMRTWSDLASAGRAFAKLRVLMLGWQDDVTEWLFKYVGRFPRLCHIIFTDCKNVHQKNRAEWEAVATENGWIAHHAKKSVKLLRPLLDDRSFYSTAVSSLYYHSQDLSQSLSLPGKPKEEENLPLLECWLGTPRPWTHILDEFPGTRTVWFEKTKANAAVSMDVSSDRPIDPESAKRMRDIANTSQSTPSPPHKRPHNKRWSRAKAPVQTATDLLAGMGVRPTNDKRRV